MSEFTPKVHRNISLPAGTHPPEVIRRTHSESDAESSGILGGQYGGSSKSSLSSSTEQIDDTDTHLEAFEEEENAEPWSTKAHPDILVSMSPKARKRQDLIHELIASEVSHVRWLRILRHVFHNPLHQHGMLSEEELSNLFPNLPTVMQKHRKLCTDLKALAADSPIVQTIPLADALKTTLGDPKYPKALAKFCKGQRLALDALRDKRKRTKELNSFLTKCEQDPLCARLHLQELLACVWQRLTKYQLLLEGIIKTVKDENNANPESPDDNGLVRLEEALNIAKDVLHNVNTAVKTTENRKRLKDIQKKMEIRGVSSTGNMTGTGSSNVSGGVNLGGGVGASGNSSTVGSVESDHGDLRKFDLSQHSLVMEGSLSIRLDGNKQTTVLGLFLSECLVLLQKETDRYILKPIPRAGLSQPLSPIVRWDTVFFRSDASTKFGFLLLGINGRHMYELAATNHSEFNTWVKNITEFANAVGPRSGTVEEGPPPPLPSNPPPSTIPSSDIMSNGTSEENANTEGETPQAPKDEDDGKTISGAVQLVEGEVDENRRPSSINMIAEDLITPSSVAIVTPPVALTAERLITPEERLRLAEEKISIALQEAAEAAKETATARPSIYSAMGTLLGNADKKSIDGQLLDQESNDEKPTVSTMELLLTAQTHVNTLTEVLLKALRVTPVECSMTVCSLHMNSGLCDTCAARHSKFSTSTSNINCDNENAINNGDATFNNMLDTDDAEKVIGVCNTGLLEQVDEKMDSIVQLEEVGESSTDPCNDPNVDLITSSSLGLREILTTLIQRLPAEEKEREFLRARLQQSDQRLHRLHHMHKDCVISESNNDSNVNTIQEAGNSSSTDQSSGEG